MAVHLDFFDFIKQAYDLGFILIPLYDKVACIPWKYFQTSRLCKADTLQLFRNNECNGIGVIAGATSNHLVCRDCDSIEAFEHLTASSPHTISQCPISKTSRGYHIFFRNTEEIYHRYGNGDGEMIGNNKHYIALPCSYHPSGVFYEWLKPVNTINDFPFLSYDEFGINRDDNTVRNDDIFLNNTFLFSLSQCVTPSKITYDIKRAITLCIPVRNGERHKKIFELCRRLKTLEETKDKTAEEMRLIVEEWHRQSYGRIGTKPFKETWIDFRNGWDKVRQPIKDFVQCSKALIEVSETPQEINHHHSIILRQIATVCRNLQISAGRDTPFFIGNRKLAEICECSHMTANRWINTLRKMNLLQMITKGRYEEASTYLYRGMLRNEIP